MCTTEKSPGWVEACSSAEVIEGRPIGLSLLGIPVALYRVEGCLYASRDQCTHAYALLSEGYLEGHSIECPLHGAMYDIRDGRCLAVADDPLQTYEVRESDGVVSVLFTPEPSLGNGRKDA